MRPRSCKQCRSAKMDVGSDYSSSTGHQGMIPPGRCSLNLSSIPSDAFSDDNHFVNDYGNQFWATGFLAH